MDITEVRIKLTEDSGERLKAFCSITFDNCFVVRDLKIIEGANGPFVAMPSRKLTFHCPECRGKNHLRASYCNHCGRSLRENQPPADAEGRIKLYADIAHPINSHCRELIQDKVIGPVLDLIPENVFDLYPPHIVAACRRTPSGFTGYSVRRQSESIGRSSMPTR